MRLILTAAAVAALCACGFPAADGREATAQALVAALERMVPLPDASRPLAGYERYYSVSRDRISAIYLAASGGAGRVHLVGANALPTAKAEGCSAVTMVFDRAVNQFQRITCNDVRLTHAGPVPALVAPAPSGGERG